MEFKPAQEGEWAGLVILMSAGYHLRFETGLLEGEKQIRLIQRVSGQETVTVQLPCQSKEMLLRIESTGTDCTFSFAIIGEDGFVQPWNVLAENICLSPYSVSEANRFTGTFLGMYATSNGKISQSFADFDWFEYQEI